MLTLSMCRNIRIRYLLIYYYDYFNIMYIFFNGVVANVFHRDLKPKNILANADCKLKICDFGLARVAFNDTPTAIFWTDYVATRWYRAPELCGSFFSKYTPAIDIWSIGCIFAELLTGKPLFPGKNVVHQLDLMTDLLGTPSPEAIARVRNEKARRYLSSMRKKKPIPFSQKFPNADPLALCLLERMLAFEPKDRPTAEEALADPYFKGLAKVEREPTAQPVTKMEFEFERRRITKEDVRELIYREILEYHPKMLKESLDGSEPTGFMYPSAVDHFKKQFAYLEEHYGNGAPVAPPERQHASLPRPCVLYSDNTIQNSAAVTNDLSKCSIKEIEKPHVDRSDGVPMTRLPLQVPQSIQGNQIFYTTFVPFRNLLSPKFEGETIVNLVCNGIAVVTCIYYMQVLHDLGKLQVQCCVTIIVEQQQQRILTSKRWSGIQLFQLNTPLQTVHIQEETQPVKMRGEDEGVEGPNGLQPKPQYMARKVAAAQGGPGHHWY
ncbi:hypothetical protein NC651_023700 [Populus alba x Populus x berolinensis]|nr:hypothetical protein NC651_023700 [Populus alba x Populus x berolinensis]